ncbi:hypothetical protein AAG906_028201 [Vitis piasezkii]
MNCPIHPRCRIPMEKTPTNTNSAGLLLVFKINICFWLFQLFIQPLVNFASTGWKVWTKAKSPDPDPVLGPQHDTGHNRKLKGGELKMVMDRLGVTYHSDGEKLEEGLVADELPQLFEEEPSLEEVKKAFDVFDENKDGFIDATELQRVLCSLGLKEGSQVEDCRRMIKAFDEDDDGQIDFKEFVKFLEKSFS